MYTLEICFEDINREVKKNHKVTNKGLIRRAYDFAAEKHKNQKPRKTGEPYILHPIRVAYIVACWGFEADTICGALLHDTLEDTDATYSEIEGLFGKNIADLVDAVTAIQIEIRDKTGLTKEEIDELSDRRLKEKMSEKALFIKAADRIDNLRTIAPFSEEKKIAKAKHTREIIIPMLKKEGAYQLIDVLEDLCLQIEHPDRYAEITSAYSALRNNNAYTTAKTLKLFSEVFSPNNTIDSSEYRTVLGSIVDFTHNPRSTISVYRQLNAQADNITTDLPRLLCKKNIAMYDLTLIISDDYCTATLGDSKARTTPTNAFFKLYSSFLEDKNITVVDFGMTTYKDSKYYILSDEMNNLYRLFVKSETEYMRYKLGHIIDDEAVTDFGAAIDGKKIKVYKKDQTAMYIENGATFLDFAFAVHSEIGLHFDYALIDGSLTQRKPYERINEGDIITIVPNPDIEPNLHWFKYVKTGKAMDHLIKYLSNR